MRTIFSSFVNKIYYYIVILFLCYVFPFASEDFVFPLLRWIILDFEIERIKKKSQRFFNAYCVDGQMELILKHKCTFIWRFWCSYHFNTPVCVILKYPHVKRKNNAQSSCMFFFSHFKRHYLFTLFIKVVSQWIWATRNLLMCYPIFNLSFLRCWKKVEKINIKIVHPTCVYPT